MRLAALISALLLTVTALSPQALQCQESGALEDVYVVADYDISRDPAVDLETAATRAQAEGKRILIQVGGDWCGWCHRLDLYIKEHSSISENLVANYLMMKVNWSRENENEAFLSQFPTIEGYPHLFVMESDGTFLHSQGTGELEEGSSYNEETILNFLREWAPPELD